MDVFGTYERGLFLKRSIREELRIGAVPPNIPLADLPSRFEGGAQATIRTRATRGLTLAGSGFGRLRKYVDSNDPSLPSFSRLDFREWGGSVEVSGRFANVWRLSGTAMLRDRVYPNREARNQAGVLVPGLAREFLYWDLRASAEFDGWIVRNALALVLTRRQDRSEGYYSYYQWELGDRLRINLTRALDVRLRYAYGERNYDVYAPTGSPLLNKYHAGRAAVNVKPHSFWRLVVGVQFERSLSSDPIFQYDRFQIIGEIQVR